jgi:hypothetical protein
VSAVEAVRTAAVAADGSHVFAGAGIDQRTAEIAAVIDPAFLAEAGWDRTRLVLFPPSEHPLLGRPVCRAAGCSTTATDQSRLCAACRRRLAEHGLDVDQLASLPARHRRSGRGPGMCLVTGCLREWVSSRTGLCRTHSEQQRTLRIASVVEFLAHRQTRPLRPCDPCAVAACTRQRRHPDGLYCGAHQQRVRAARARDPLLEEARWQTTEPAVGRGGEVSLRGLPLLVIAETLFGLQQRCRVNAVKTDDAVLRAFCDDLRRQQVGSLAGHVVADARGLEFAGLANCLAGHARRALSTPETEVVNDEWDLAVFGQSGTVSFTGISQRWLREAAKRWAGAPYLRYLNNKMARQAAVPIDEELQAEIRVQQQRVAARWPDTHPYLFPNEKGHLNKPRPLSYYSYRGSLIRWLADCDIRDEHGQPAKLTPHQWRHTFACRLINRDVPQEVIRVLLDHQSTQMTAHYADPRELHQAGEKPQVAC